MEDYHYYILSVILLLSFLLPIGYMIGQNRQVEVLTETPENVNIMLGGLELWNFREGNYSFNVTLQNTLEYPVKLMWIVESDFTGYVDYSCSVTDGTVIKANSNVTSKVDLTVTGDVELFKLHGKGVSP